MLLRNIIANGIFIGFIATLVTTVFMILLRARGKTVLNQHFFFGRELLKRLHKKPTEKASDIMGLVSHFFAGTVFGFIYMMLPIPHAALTGFLYAFMPWLLMIFVLFPLFGQGCCGKKLDGKKPKIKVIWQTLFFHLLYGIALGWFASM